MVHVEELVDAPSSGQAPIAESNSLPALPNQGSPCAPLRSTSRRPKPVYQGDFRFIRTHNMGMVREIMTNPRIYKWITEDGSPDANAYWPEDHPGIWWMLVRDGGELIGCYSLRVETSVCFDVHCTLMPHAAYLHGRPVASLRALFEWVWAETTCQRITAKIPEYNRLALQMALKAQMMVFGVNDNSFPKGGRNWGQILVGISRPGA